MNEKPYPSQLAERIIVRLPDGMRDRLAEEARKNKRSTNAEVVARLEASFQGDVPNFDMTEFVEELTVRLIQTFELAMNRALFGKNPPEIIGLDEITLLGWLESRGVDISRLRVPPLPATSHADGSFDPLVARPSKSAGHQRKGDDHPAPTGPATDAVAAMDEAIGKDRAKPKRAK